MINKILIPQLPFYSAFKTAMNTSQLQHDHGHH